MTDRGPAVSGIRSTHAASGKPLHELPARQLRQGLRGVLRGILAEADDPDLRLLAARGVELLTELEGRSEAPPTRAGRPAKRPE